MTSETYPSKPITFWTIFPYLVIIVLAFLLFKSCGKVEPKPVVITGKEVRDTVRLIERERQFIADSFNAIIYKQDAEIRNYKSKYDDLVADYLNIQNETQNVITKTPFPDTCKPIVDLLTGKFNQLSIASQKKDKAASNTINSLTAQNKTKDKFLAAKDSSYKKLKSIADTCSSALSQMEAYAKKIKPKTTIYISAIALGNQNKYLNGYGMGIGLTNKKGTSFEVGAINIGTTINYSLSIKKPLFKF